MNLKIVQMTKINTYDMRKPHINSTVVNLSLWLFFEPLNQSEPKILLMA